MAKPPRVKVPKTAKKGDIIQIKTLIPHKMESGQRKDKQGKIIPRFIINKVLVTFNGTDTLRADLHPAISANPFFSFYARVNESGTFEFTWTDDAGKSVSTSRKIAVS